MSKAKQKAPRASASLRRDPLASLRMADMVISKPVLPAEIISHIVDFLSAPDLIRLARVSRHMQEMVYDDSRWIQRLQMMGCWNETEARQRAESSRQASKSVHFRRQSTIDQTVVNGKGRPEAKIDTNAVPPLSSKLRTHTADGFDQVSISSPVQLQPTAEDHRSNLAILQRVRSIRGQARQEYGKVYRILGPLYLDAIAASQPMDSLIFKQYTAPDDQAQMLAQVRRFAHSDPSPGGEHRDRRISEMVNTFDTAALLEFRQGYEYRDIQGRMRQYARVMHLLDGGSSAVELFLHDNKVITQKASFGSASDCVDYSLGFGQLSLEKVQSYFERLADAFNQEAAVVEAVFPDPNEVTLSLLEAVGQEILSPFVTTLFNDALTRGHSTYLRIASGTFAAAMQFVAQCNLPDDRDREAKERINAVISEIYGPHLENYLAEEMESFKKRASKEIEQWDQALREQAASTENFLMSHFNRQADKKDFMSSFKKVVMAPVNLLPSFSSSTGTKPAAKPLANGDLNVLSRSSTPNPMSQMRSGTPSLPPEAPTTELAAKTALMNSRLENIRSLFSIEIALNLVHAAKSSLERTAQFMTLGGSIASSACASSSAIFLELLHTIGDRHVKTGFDTAISHLSNYKPREASSHECGNVAPLTTFLELVNVGDLIQQMIDVFYESEIVRLRISNRDDYLDSNFKAKRKFESMLDERVASGLSKGIDVLMGEVEYLCATTQKPTDFIPVHGLVVDVGPTETAKQVIEVVGGHMKMLNGATDKTLLDVFVGEVGLRLFGALCKHIKRQRISSAGAVLLISDLSAYANFIAGFRNNDLNTYYLALREVAQIYLFEGTSNSDINQMASIITEHERYQGVMTVEEVVEFAERRSDWLLVKNKVERKVQGDGCVAM